MGSVCAICCRNKIIHKNLDKAHSLLQRDGGGDIFRETDTFGALSWHLFRQFFRLIIRLVIAIRVRNGHVII